MAEIHIFYRLIEIVALPFEFVQDFVAAVDLDNRLFGQNLYEVVRSAKSALIYFFIEQFFLFFGQSKRI